MLLLVLIVAAPLANYIPFSVLAAILIVVVWNMGEWHEIPQLWKLTKSDITVGIVTFALTALTSASATGSSIPIAQSTTASRRFASERSRESYLVSGADPDGTKPTRVQMLVAGRTVPLKQSGLALEIHVPVRM